MNRDTPLDHAARLLHGHALAAVPVAVRVQLHPRGRPAHGRAWGAVLAMAVVGGLALAAAWQLRLPARAPQGLVAGIASGTAGADASAVSPTAAFDNDPEFYAWLGTGTSVAMVEH